MSLTVKAGSDIAYIHKVFFRHFVTFILISSILIIRKESFKPVSLENLKYLVIRSLTGLTGVFFYFYSIMNLPLADSAMLSKLSPFFVIISAVFLLKEKIKLSNIPLILTAFAGAVLVIKPQLSYSVLPALSGTTAAVLAGISYSIVRLLKGRETPYKVILYFSGISVILIFIPAVLQFRTYPLSSWLILLLIGLFATGGQYFLTIGFQSYRAGDISIITYSQIIFSLILGFLFFSELPDVYSAVGGVLIIGSAAVLYMRK